ncbi:hypothetical protein BFL38_09815 [Brachyspira hampsonii]|uniref:Peptidase M30, hyicolysin n=1 Tax=Brachyspira hampsonii TaxID=1287055 RepID=A0A1E5NHZ4_9SPIR|nr:hypothetical protein [Brachyspira hampsonii]OEJ15754.1 hypothetical protein BFL38_09815 [Brachyspira hampsonii]
MKNIYLLLLFIVSIFIVSCGNKITAPSETMDGITYYDPSTAETKQYSFYRLDHNTGYNIFVKESFRKLAESKNTIIYVEDGQDITRADIMNFINKFEEYYPKELEIYGEHSDIDGNGKIIFLMASLNTNKKPNSGNMGGYFDPKDLLYGKDGVKGEYLHVDFTYGIDKVIGVMMHELQHLINYNVNVFNGNKSMDIWLNEALSESTSHLFSKDIVKSRENAFLKTPYYSFYSWYMRYANNNRDNIFGASGILISYSSSSIFMNWLNTKTGGDYEIFKEIAHSNPSLTSEERLTGITSKYGLGDNMDDVMLNWIDGLSKGELPGISISAISPNDPNISKNGSILLLPRSVIVYNTSSIPADAKTKRIQLSGQAWNGFSAVVNTSENKNVGYVDEADIVSLNLPQVNVLNSSMKYKSLDLNSLEGDYFIDKVFSEYDIIIKE